MAESAVNTKKHLATAVLAIILPILLLSESVYKALLEDWSSRCLYIIDAQFDKIRASKSQSNNVYSIPIQLSFHGDTASAIGARSLLIKLRGQNPNHSGQTAKLVKARLISTPSGIGRHHPKQDESCDIANQQENGLCAPAMLNKDGQFHADSLRAKLELSLAPIFDDFVYHLNLLVESHPHPDFCSSSEKPNCVDMQQIKAELQSAVFFGINQSATSQQTSVSPLKDRSVNKENNHAICKVEAPTLKNLYYRLGTFGKFLALALLVAMLSIAVGILRTKLGDKS